MTKRKGKPLNLSNEQLDEQADVTPADILAGQAWAKKHLPPKAKGLLDADPDDDISTDDE